MAPEYTQTYIFVQIHESPSASPALTLNRHESAGTVGHCSRVRWPTTLPASRLDDNPVQECVEFVQRGSICHWPKCFDTGHDPHSSRGRPRSLRSGFRGGLPLYAPVTITGLQIRSGVAGQSGAVVVDSGISAAAPVQSQTGSGTIEVQSSGAASATMSTALDQIAIASRYQINSHGGTRQVTSLYC
jgi:hypothetical protein